MALSPKPLKEFDKSKINSSDGARYLLNSKKNTAIKIPSTVLKVLQKLNANIFLGDALITALHLRSFGDDELIIKNWHESSYDMYQFPNSTPNQRFLKFMENVFNVISHELTEKETDTLLYFFARVPHGYTLPDNLIRCHYELRHTIL
ncbi:hypothetical protein HFE03_07685 [Paenibacillus sp. EKM102P]|uniref:hypothetical protein n=1 Tax=unclassified Paenibacillus TaxID=185978 RepID=UPI00142D8CAB|nr:MULTISPECIES: hypothetical protein [unclassified Paenibacillus]KAF6620524.1 hypothetical protein HFE00_05590 [Paenibacillus sp. EKM101P]KAF6623516.1 hypothetical protein HFE03_07685 [Paenibacillus sp. EKM102P]KAF6633920.1 hypothetical protein HFE01_06820 [Paenibacillus sp. EKM10P]KAF6649448.1 hypothetical protein HFE02_01785 [Paenibacillus sp. EKM11P]